MLGGGGSVAFEGLLYMCWTGLWFAPLLYVTCIEIGGGALVMRTGALEQDGGIQSVHKESPRIEFSSPRAADESRRVSEDSPM